MTPEARFAAKVRGSIPDCYVTRIESRVGLGIPDMLLAFKDTGTFVMLELKAVTRGLQVRLSPHQIAFLTKHASIGCPAFLLVLHKKEGDRTGRVLLYHGRDAVALSNQGIRMTPLESWATDSMDWERLGFILRTNQKI